MPSDNIVHKSVMLAECLALFSPALDSRNPTCLLTQGLSSKIPVNPKNDLFTRASNPSSDHTSKVKTKVSSKSNFPIFVDCTLGLGGHSGAVLENFPQVRVVGIDRDLQALNQAKKNLQGYKNRVSFHQVRFDELDQVIDQVISKQTLTNLIDIPRSRNEKFLNPDPDFISSKLSSTKSSSTASNNPVRIIFFDLGLSSLQIEDESRGFSYSKDTWLDMRMDQSQGQTAHDFLNHESKEKIAQILISYGQEKFAHSIAKKIVEYRKKRPINTSFELVDLIKQAIPLPARRKGGNPAKRTFQAIRIHLNQELQSLEVALEKAFTCLAPRGRLIVESYHSLEDALVKKIFTNYCKTEKVLGLPVDDFDQLPRAHALTKKPLLPTKRELEDNPRAASVKLRALEKI